MGLKIVGLGPGDPRDLTRGAWDALSNASRVYLRTRVHPTVDHLPFGPEYLDFDALYETASSFSDVYDQIVATLVGELSDGQEIVYAVPGDPTIAERTVTRLLAVCREKDIPVLIFNAVSFIEPTMAAVGIDALDGLQIFDAIDIAQAKHPPINPDFPALVGQVYGQSMASDVKLTLMNQYSDDFQVALIHAAGTDQEKVEHLPLYEMDRGGVAHLTTLYIPAIASGAGAIHGFESFQQTIATLRDPEDGCPWDREQTHESLRPYVLEETYEVLEAIDSGDPKRLVEELGDLLLQVVLHAQIGTDDGEFSMADIIRTIDAKLKRRHPHVWGTVDVNGSAEQVRANWQEIKEAERSERGASYESILDGVPTALPALTQANQYDQRARQVGFDWESIDAVIDKVQEEIREVQQAKTDNEQFWEIGDLLLAASVWARWLNINPEDALRAANRRFYDRFTYIESKVRADGRGWDKISASDLMTLWNEAKQNTSSSDANTKTK